VNVVIKFYIESPANLKMSYVRTQGKTVHGEAQEVIASIMKPCDEEGRRKELTFYLTCGTDNPARHTGVI
jgi:hypothetical protein